MMTAKEAQRFLAKINRFGDCWRWNAVKNPAGKGRFLFRGRVRNAACVSLMEISECPGDGFYATATCETLDCVNPAHLEWGQRWKTRQTSQYWLKKRDARFDAQTERSGECILWKGSKDRAGYGIFGADARQISAHRYALWRDTGRLPNSKIYACHTCRTPACVNPKHLYWGTPGENSRDRYRDNPPSGPAPMSRSSGKRLSDNEVKQAWDMYWHDRKTANEVAAAFSVGITTIGAIMRRKNRAQLTGSWEQGEAHHACKRGRKW